MPTKLQFIKKFTTRYKQTTKKKTIMKSNLFDLYQIIIYNDFEIVAMTITKIHILHKSTPMKHHHWNIYIYIYI
jgi:hypothetical protein